MVKWSSGAWDSQLGTAAILKALFQIDPHSTLAARHLL